MFISGETVIILRIVFSTETGHWIKYYMRIVSIHDSMYSFTFHFYYS